MRLFIEESVRPLILLEDKFDLLAHHNQDYIYILFHNPNPTLSCSEYLYIYKINRTLPSSIE